ncbi:MAG: hypothetical protein UU73_C0003G0119 [Candidatus Daviesbacteria bacterium GW2011_GWA1_41_61]|uniref:Nudix hydrolase domain-containing protein n=1 Tax=Candidatus Daviesbacteria bacterium GW2011_GWA2_40_9 TaxID=1618424 RepID=A0A0G0U272_9BACT|nr:MAG: hypothetical protein UU26_C0003G0107 [Candidatus Daviesbacteria bacterium GW2011_GWC1_40_9]KKR83183.1 MAG: hypothetical protein UU29_C0007G0053 [Candidatus Daviesbacteria bacterium GW2011_GWA2_40_9]KKR93530.1 MAG: hypothetical protein UU44_C0002G0191 [Candidatus Daviesbacteria bacterium GW2011_GWB1_41_15]KKS14920.1 MAG: hypothetical protein UU73_C0003G0119 [Candidatus Daviesbacteria bacterium GW2011_GWA1_41_61]
MDGAIGIVFDKDKKVLMVKRRDVPIWVLPGGRIEKSESPQQAVVREVWEESGFQTKVKRKVGEYCYHNSKRINHLFECQIISGSAQTSNESKDVAFFYPNNLPKLHDPQLLTLLNDTRSQDKQIIKKEVPPISKKVIFNEFFKHPTVVIRYLFIRIGIRINT